MTRRVALLGGPGAFSEEAAERLLGVGGWTGVYRPTLAEVAAAVSQGEADAAVLPIENSIAGPVEESWEAWWTQGLFGFAETTLAVHQCLMGLPGVALGEVREAWSHPQALAQCAPFLEQHGIKAVPVGSTVAGAEAVVAKQQRAIASLGNARTAQRHGLAVIADGVQARKDNATRFVAVGREGPAVAPPGLVRTVLGLQAPEAGWVGWNAFIGSTAVLREHHHRSALTVLRCVELETQGLSLPAQAPLRVLGRWSVPAT